MKVAPTCFGLQRNQPQGATASTQLKLQAWISVDMDVVETSVLWRHSNACVLCTVQEYTLAQCTTHTAIKSSIAMIESEKFKDGFCHQYEWF
jgi:hypothetical protein